MMNTYTGNNHHTITIVKSAAIRTSTSFWTAAVKTVLNITKVVSHYHYIVRCGGAEQFFKLCILYCVCTQSTHSQRSLTFAGQITQYTEGQMHVCTKSYLGIGIEADAAGIGIPASCISVRYRSILKKKQDGAAWHSRRVLAFWAGIFKKSMGARNRGGIGLSDRPARLHRLAELIPWNQFRVPINI